MPILASVGQVARALGPPILSNTYALASYLSPGCAPNVTIILTLGSTLTALLIPFAADRELFYGKFDDPPFMKPSASAEKKGML